MNKKLWLIPAALSTLLLTTAGACSESQDDAPEPTSSQMQQLTKLQVIQMPDGFRNVVYGCIPNTTTQIFVTSRGAIEGGTSGTMTPSSITVIEDARFCGGSGKSTPVAPSN